MLRKWASVTNSEMTGMHFARKGDLLRHRGFLAVALVAAAMPQTTVAQGLANPEAVETIIGSDVEVEESGARTEGDAVIAALDATSTSIDQVRKTFALDNVEIIFLPDIGDATSPVGREVEEHREEIAELHQTIEGNPIFYHAAESRSLPVRDIVALEFDNADGVKIYATGEAPAE